MIDSQKLEKKRLNAVEASERLVELLESLNLGLPEFKRVFLALLNEELTEAIEIQETIRSEGKGPSEDFWKKVSKTVRDARVQGKLLFFLGVQSQTMGNIRVYLQYEIDRPVVNCDFDSLDEATLNSLFLSWLR